MNKLIVNTLNRKCTINKNIYGHFSEHLGRCIYQGIFVGKDSSIPNVNGMRTDVVEALKHIQVPVLRWPGGCFADEYHWKDGIGLLEKRKKMINTHWGGVVEDNSFGIHEFLELCRQIGCEPYINGNLGSGTVQEMSEWVEYLNSDDVSPMTELRHQNGRDAAWKVKYFGVGNENWGCGGNMRPSYYADEYRRYQTYLHRYGDHRIFRIACGASAQDYNWTETVMDIAGRYMDALTLHYYTLPTGDWKQKGSATQFDKDAYYQTIKRTLQMEDLLTHHLNIMDRYDPDHRVGLIVDEWGTWYDVEPGTNPGFLYQQNTMRDAIVAAINLNIFNHHSDRVIMTNIAQIVNVLQAVILTDGEKMVLTPTYHVFDLYKAHQDATLVDTWLSTEMVGVDDAQVPQISVSASVKEDGILTITLANTSESHEAELACEIGGMQVNGTSSRILMGLMDDYNGFSSPGRVAIHAFKDIETTATGFNISLPPCSVTEVLLW